MTNLIMRFFKRREGGLFIHFPTWDISTYLHFYDVLPISEHDISVLNEKELTAFDLHFVKKYKKKNTVTKTKITRSHYTSEF